MRLVIEVTEAERDALTKFLQSLDPSPSYSSLFRTLLRMAVDGSLPIDALKKALDDRRPVLNVTLQGAVSAVSGPFSPLQAQKDAMLAQFKAAQAKLALLTKNKKR